MGDRGKSSGSKASFEFDEDDDRFPKLLVYRGQIKNVESDFQMPLHYPSYKKEDYETMSEAALDRLFEVYGMTGITGDLDYKRKFAIGAFIWNSS